MQVMDALGIEKVFVLGTSQGGWITVRTALVAPKRVGLAKVFEGSFEKYSKCVLLWKDKINLEVDSRSNSSQYLFELQVRPHPLPRMSGCLKVIHRNHRCLDRY